MNLKFRAGLTAILGIGLWSGWAAAQMFGEETPAAVPDKTETQVQPQTGRVSGWNNRDRLGGNWWGIRTTPKQQAAQTCNGTGAAADQAAGKRSGGKSRGLSL